MPTVSTGLNGKVLNSVIDFDLLVNSELGLIRLIRKKYQNEDAFDLDTLNKSDREILSLLYSRTNPNPLSIISTEENMENIDPLYESFLESKKQDILELSTSEKRIFDFVSIVEATGMNLGVLASIAVNDDTEIDFLRRKFKMIQTQYKSDKASLLFKEVFYINDHLFFKGIEDKVDKKKIYFLPKQYTLDYLENTENTLTLNNVFMTFGRDFRINKDGDEHHGESK